MDTKSIRMEPSPLSEKIFNIGKVPFKLWLEFEVSSPWDDLENDHTTIGVDTLDGRIYGLNVWTYKYLETSIKQDEANEQNLSGLYQIPPDLFVKELTRSCIEKTISDLLDIGNLEEQLNNSIFGLKYINPYQDVMDVEDKISQDFFIEFKLKLPDNHPLQNENIELIAKKTNCDDIVLELEDGRIAVAQFTLKSKIEFESYPVTIIYKDKVEFWKREMKQDIIDFRK